MDIEIVAQLLERRRFGLIASARFIAFHFENSIVPQYCLWKFFTNHVSAKLLLMF